MQNIIHPQEKQSVVENEGWAAAQHRKNQEDDYFKPLWAQWGLLHIENGLVSESGKVKWEVNGFSHQKQGSALGNTIFFK